MTPRLSHPPVTGVSGINERGDILLFVRPLREVPRTLHLDGHVVSISSSEAILSRDTYGSLCIEALEKERPILVVELDANGDVVRTTPVVRGQRAGQ